MILTHQHFSLDTETLAFYDNAIILSIALTPFKLMEKDITFDELVERSFFIKLDVEAQFKEYNRKSDRETLDWWKKQSNDIKKYSYTKSKDDVHPKLALLKMNEYISSTQYNKNKSYVFERGMGFDSNKIDTLYRQTGVPHGLNFWRGREIRTINDLIGDVHNGKWELPEGNPPNFIEHHALHDAALDALKLIRLFDLG